MTHELQLVRADRGMEFVRHNGVTIGAVMRGAERVAGRYTPSWRFIPTPGSGLRGVTKPSKRELEEALRDALARATEPAASESPNDRRASGPAP